ncbi:MAG: NAD+ synthase [Fervidicoccaceae archaeon]
MLDRQPAVPVIDYARAADRISQCVKDYLDASGAKGYVLGVSGGLDSAVTAYLLVRGVGKERVHALILPERETDIREIEDAKLVADSLGIRYVIADISEAVEGILKMFGESYGTAERVAKGNVKARVRMTALYFLANTRKLLVSATSDRSEFLLGYFTKWGDGAGDVYPIISLYKTQVREMAKFLGVPEKIWRKPSSPGLWPGQTAEGEIGLSYEEIDTILHMLVDRQETVEEASRLTGIPIEKVETVWKKVISSSHKRFRLQSCGI